MLDNGAEGVPAPEATSRSSLGWTDERGVAWATFGASLLMGIAGAIVLAVGVDDRRSVENAPDGTRWSTVRERYERAPWLLGTGLAAAVVGAVGVGCGAALLAWSGEGGTWLEVAIVGSGARVRGRF